MALNIVKADQKGLHQISTVAKVIWYSTYLDTLGQKQVDYMLDLFYSEEALSKNNNKGHMIFLINEEEIFVGYLDLEIMDYGVFIHKFYLNNSGQRKGTGTEVMNLLIDEMNVNGKIMKLHVNRMNYKAINFYFKNGFKIEQLGDFDIGGGYYMNDFVMMREV